MILRPSNVKKQPLIEGQESEGTNVSKTDSIKNDEQNKTGDANRVLDQPGILQVRYNSYLFYLGH